MKYLLKKLLSNLEISVNRLFGYKYRVNFNSNEIHYLPNKHKNCNLEVMDNYKNVTKFAATHYLNSGLNGCRWCFKSQDKG